MGRKFLACLLPSAGVFALVIGSACVPPDTSLGIVGEERAAYFASIDTDKVFSAPLMVGSVF